MDAETRGGNGAAVGDAVSYTVRQATEALEGLRGAIEQASTTMRELTRAGGELAGGAQVRTRDIAGQVRSQGQRAAGTVAHQVETYPLTSLLLAFGVGYCIGALTRR
jgi:hypothetical protein